MGYSYEPCHSCLPHFCTSCSLSQEFSLPHLHFHPTRKDSWAPTVMRCLLTEHPVQTPLRAHQAVQKLPTYMLPTCMGYINVCLRSWTLLWWWSRLWVLVFAVLLVKPLRALHRGSLVMDPLGKQVSNLPSQVGVGGRPQLQVGCWIVSYL